MEYSQTAQLNNKIKLIKELLQKQVLSDEKKNNVISILNYLAYQCVTHEDDIYLENEIKLLYDCIL